MPKYVVSSTLKDPTWTNTTVLDGDPVGALTRLKETFDGDLVVHGSARLVQTLVEHDLADELRLMTFPVLLGSGKRLFADTSEKKTSLELAESNVVGDGVIILVYKRRAD